MRPGRLIGLAESEFMEIVAESNLERSKAIITGACSMLDRARMRGPGFAREIYEPSSDCYVLLVDATKMFCQALSECHPDARAPRWSPQFTEFLFAHPEKCREALALLESMNFETFDSQQLGGLGRHD